MKAMVAALTAAIWVGAATAGYVSLGLFLSGSSQTEGIGVGWWFLFGPASVGVVVWVPMYVYVWIEDNA